jgi:hypothetical protein
MAWIIGIDEAGYGPNLGPFVTSSIAFQVPDEMTAADLWHVLGSAVRRAKGPADGRLLVDDSKVVYSTQRGLHSLERGVLATLWRGPVECAFLRHFLEWACPDCLADLEAETWFRGDSPLPCQAETNGLAADAERFDQICQKAGVCRGPVRSMTVCTPHFNALAEAAGSKGAVLTHALGRLLRFNCNQVPGDDPLWFFIDKQGGRNAYAASIQHALPEGTVLAEQEGRTRSAYRVVELRREVRLVFQPRADAAHFSVALASMTSKYLRERLMGEFNAFWQKHVPGLKPTAGYPGDAARFYQTIQPIATKLGLTEEVLWRRR